MGMDVFAMSFVQYHIYIYIRNLLIYIILMYTHEYGMFAQTIFLYRQGVDVVDSFCMAFFNSTANQFMRKLSLDSLFLFKLSGFSSFFPVVAPLMSDPRFPREVYTRLGAIGLTTMMWISTMDVAMKMQQKVFYFYIRKYAWASLYRNYIYIYIYVCV